MMWWALCVCFCASFRNMTRDRLFVVDELDHYEIDEDAEGKCKCSPVTRHDKLPTLHHVFIHNHQLPR